MTRTQLRLLLIIPRIQLLTNTIQQLHITLLRILLQTLDKRITHRPRRRAANLRIRTRLCVLTATPHDHVRRARLGTDVPLIRIASLGCLLEKTHGRARHSAEVAAHVGRGHAEEAFAGFFGQVGLFENALGAVDVGQVEGGAGVAGIEDAGEADARSKGADHDLVHLVVDDVADGAEVDGVDYFVVAVFFVAV